MRYDADERKALALVQAQAARKLAEIHQMLAPGITEPADKNLLRELAHKQMAELSPRDREKLRLRSIVAYSELQRLMSELSQHLVDVGEELRKVNRQSSAVRAYGRTVQNTRRSYAL